MVLFGALDVTLKASSANAVVQRWSQPAYATSIRSPTIMMATGDDLVIIHPRIAQAMAIRDGDRVEFVFEQVGKSFFFPVKVREVQSDILLHDLQSLGVAHRIEMNGREEKITLSDLPGKLMYLGQQALWAGAKLFHCSGSARLYFDGASRSNPNGPCGYGFRILSSEDEVLIEGYGYAGMKKSNNEMEYHGLLEGLHWATKLDLGNLTVHGDSEVVINQMAGTYGVNSDKLKAYHKKIRDLLDDFEGLSCSYVRIPREENEVADALANLGIATKQVNVTCHWSRINEFVPS